LKWFDNLHILILGLRFTLALLGTPARLSDFSALLGPAESERAASGDCSCSLPSTRLARSPSPDALLQWEGVRGRG